MSASPIDAIARTVLYEGYLLYPYRPSAVKNQQRFNVGVLYPEAFCGVGSDAWQLQAECPLTGAPDASIDVSVRFLQMIERQPLSAGSGTWQEAIEREVAVGRLAIGDGDLWSVQQPFSFLGAGDVDPAPAGTDDRLAGDIVVELRGVRARVYTLRVRVANRSRLETSMATRSDALLRSLVSAHVVIRTTGAELVSLLEPPDTLRDVAAACTNVGVWPVMVGEPGARDCMLASPIILYDYPRIAPESSGDLFDGTEIDEILALRILTLTDDEKREVRAADARAREILDRTETLPPEHWARLHGAIRGLQKPRGAEIP